MILVDRPGKVVNKLFSTPVINVEIGGLKSALWRKDMVSEIVVKNRIAWATYFTSMAVDVEGKNDAAVGWCRSVNHRRVMGSRFAKRTHVSPFDAMTWPFFNCPVQSLSHSWPRGVTVGIWWHLGRSEQFLLFRERPRF